jgi:hypothetical protein
MDNLLKASGIVTAIAFAAFAPRAVAQEITTTLACQGVDGFAPEPLGDREGHKISVDHYSCRVEAGPMSGAVATGTSITEWDGSTAVERSDIGVARKPGGTLVWRGTEGKSELTMADGKVTGWTGSGTGVNQIATGSAASLAGKPYAWTAKSTGPGTWTIEGIVGKP